MKMTREEEIKILLKKNLADVYDKVANFFINEHLFDIKETATEVVDLSESINSYLLELEEINKKGLSTFS
jgi:N-acetylglutamate synthase-like GNAT family acetyltransferase